MNQPIEPELHEGPLSPGAKRDLALVSAEVRSIDDGGHDSDGIGDVPLDVLVSLSIEERHRWREKYQPTSLGDYRKLVRGLLDKSRERDDRGDHSGARNALRLALTLLVDAASRTDLRKTIVMPQPKVANGLIDYVWPDSAAVCEVRGGAGSGWKAFDGREMVPCPDHPKGLWPSSHEAARALEAKGVGPGAPQAADETVDFAPEVAS